MRYFLQPKSFFDYRVLTLNGATVCEENESAQELIFPETAKILQLETLENVGNFTENYGFIDAKSRLFGLDARIINWERVMTDGYHAVLWKDILRAPWRYAWLQFNQNYVHGIWLDQNIGEISLVPHEDLPIYNPYEGMVDDADPFRPVPLIEQLGKLAVKSGRKSLFAKVEYAPIDWGGLAFAQDEAERLAGGGYVAAGAVANRDFVVIGRDAAGNEIQQNIPLPVNPVPVEAEIIDAGIVDPDNDEPEDGEFEADDEDWDEDDDERNDEDDDAF